MSTYLNTEDLSTPTTFQTGGNFVDGTGPNVGRDNRVTLIPHYQDYNASQSSETRFAIRLPQTPSTSTFVLASSEGEHGAYLNFGISQRTNTPVNVQIRRGASKYFLSAYTDGDSDGGGKYLQQKYKYGSDMVESYSAYYGASNYSVPSNRLSGYMHYIFNFQSGQEHTIYAYLDVIGYTGVRTWVAWFD